MATQPKKSLWELLWDYDPNGLLVVDTSMHIRLVNRAFCTMFNARQELQIGENAIDLLEDVAEFSPRREAYLAVDMVTEGIITMAKTLDMMRACDGKAVRLPRDGNAAAPQPVDPQKSGGGDVPIFARPQKRGQGRVLLDRCRICPPPTKY